MTKTKEPKSLMERWAVVLDKTEAAGLERKYRLEANSLRNLYYLMNQDGEVVAHTEEAITAVLEKWVREDVVVWALREYLLRLCMPRPRVTPGFWDWAIDGVPGTSTRRVNGTEVTSEEAFLCVAEALCECLEVG